MSMLPGHWAWQRQRADHHAGAVRPYERDDAQLLDIRGPDESPRPPCSRCAAVMATVTMDTSLYQSCSSSSDDDDDDDDDDGAERATAEHDTSPLTGERYSAPYPLWVANEQ